MELSDGTGAARRVLIVEDEVIVAINLEYELADAGFEVVGPAHTVPEALALLDDEAVDLAVLDINIAGTLVWPVAERLTAQGVGFVLASANCRDPQMIDPRFADVPCFDKPVAMARMMTTLVAMPAVQKQTA